MMKLTPKLWNMTRVDINRAAVAMLDKLLERCTINLVANITALSRPMLYRWLDSNIPLDDMDHVRAAWFIVQCETNPKIKMLLERPPMSHPRLAKRVIDSVGEAK